MFCLAAAVWQCYEVAARIAQLSTMTWKFGVEPGAIDAGISTTVIFFAASAALIILGLFATDRLRAASSPMRFCSMLAVQMLVAGAVIWGGLLSSPVVALSPR